MPRPDHRRSASAIAAGHRRPSENGVVRVHVPDRLIDLSVDGPHGKGLTEPPRTDQSASDDTTSPPALVAIARQVGGATPSRTKVAWPSQNSTFTPPGWWLRAAFQPGLW